MKAKAASLLVEWGGAWTPPYLQFEGCKNNAPATSEKEWREIAKAWEKK